MMETAVIDHPHGGRVSKFTDETRARFFETLARTGIVQDACDSINVSRRAAYYHRKEDPEFAKAWAEAEEIAADALEREARRRAIDGCSKYMVSGGKVVMDPITGEPVRVKEYSDQLMALLLRARKPDVFGDKSKIEHSVQSIVINMDSSQAGEFLTKRGRIVLPEQRGHLIAFGEGETEAEAVECQGSETDDKGLTP